MGLPRTFVGFSSSDIHCYRLMLAWKASEHIDFNFADCQLNQEINSNDEAYIKRKCRDRIEMAGKFILLIGEDTRSKHKYVRWEAEVAKEKGCTIIGVNLNQSRSFDAVRCPPVLNDIGAIFISYRPKIIAHALENFLMREKDNWNYPDSVYEKIGCP